MRTARLSTANLVVFDMGKLPLDGIRRLFPALVEQGPWRRPQAMPGGLVLGVTRGAGAVGCVLGD
jgi:hypothetical protein